MSGAGAKEWFFILLLSSLAVLMVWFITWAFWDIVYLITNVELFLGFAMFGLVGMYNFGG